MEKKQVKGAATPQKRIVTVYTTKNIADIGRNTFKKRYAKKLVKKVLCVMKVSDDAAAKIANFWHNKYISRVRKAILLKEARGKKKVIVADVELPLPGRKIPLCGFNAHVTHKKKSRGKKDKDGDDDDDDEEATAENGAHDGEGSEEESVAAED